MDAIASSSSPIPPVSAYDISARGRIAASSGWHRAEQRVNALGAACEGEPSTLPPSPAWPALLARLGGGLSLANRKAAELKPTIDAANAIIAALNDLPAGAGYEDLERALGLREARGSHDRIGDAMSRVLRTLERRNDAPPFTVR